MEKNFFEWFIYVLLFIWQLPQNMVGFVMWLYFKLSGDLEMIVKNKYSQVYRSKNMLGGISLGTFAFVSNNLGQNEVYVKHEIGHMWDSKLMGPLYLLIVGLPSLLNAMFGFTKCYYSFFCEAWANKHGGIYADENCMLHINEKDKA